MADSSSSSKLTLKLLLDKQTGKVVFAEAGKDFVDFLFTILSLPVGSVTKLLSSKQMVGSLGSLHQSIQSLSTKYIKQGQSKNRVLNPKLRYCPTKANRLLTDDTLTEDASKMYPRATCGRCRGTISNGRFSFVDYSDESEDEEDEEGEEEEEKESAGGYVTGVVTYMVTDNLEVKPGLSIGSVVSLLNRMNVVQLEEKAVVFGRAEGLKLLKASLETDKVLTAVFLEDP
ncbi:hypothetical protein LINGRAHAP2_LOCUS16673 [Linum grandiflorum]